MNLLCAYILHKMAKGASFTRKTRCLTNSIFFIFYFYISQHVNIIVSRIQEAEEGGASHIVFSFFFFL